MKDLDEQKKIAVLIDADNAQHSRIKAVLAEIATHGHIITKRAYGDWSRNNLKTWKSILNEYSIQPIQQFAYTTGKNSTDASMIIDAMDLLYTGKYDSFVLVSSDSDFTKLASRLREAEKFVFGVGEAKTPTAFRNACDDFILVENLEGGSKKPEVASKNPKPATSAASAKPASPAKEAKSPRNSNTPKKKEDALGAPTIEEVISLLDIASEKFADEEGWTDVSAAGNYIKRSMPDFDTRTYGFQKLSDLIASLTELYEIKRQSGKGAGSIVTYKRISKD
jgi:uncharacterized protein (TIGR00288 family)